MNERKVALLVETARGYGRGVLRGIVRYAELHGPWSFYVTPGDFATALPELRQWGCTGIIARIATPRIGKAILATGLPAIALDLSEKQLAPGSPFLQMSELLSDSHEAGRMAAEHLLEKGFRHYAFVGIPGQVWSDRRQQAFCQRIAEAGFTARIFDPSTRRRSRQWGRDQKALAKWLHTLPKPIGLMACNDDRGREVSEACHAAHVQIPEEIALIGVDNDELLCDLSLPPLSSVALNAERGGYRAAELLNRMMSGEVMTQERIVVEPLHVVTRRSTNVVALEDTDMAACMRFIRDNADKPIRVNDIVKTLGLSRRMLEIRFRKAVGRSVNDEIQRVHLERAKRLLVDSDWPLPKIAIASGYSSASYLDVVFKRAVGVSPTKFRQRMRAR